LQNASDFGPGNGGYGALDDSVPYDPSLIDLPSASRASDLNFFDLDFGQYEPQPDAEAEAQTNTEKVDNFPAANIEPEPEQQGKPEAHSFDENTPDTAEPSFEIVEEQAAVVVADAESSQPNLVPENEMEHSPSLPRNLEVSESASAQDLIVLGTRSASDSTPQLVQSQVPGPGAGAGPQQIANLAGVQIVASASAAIPSGNQAPRSNAQNVTSTTGVQQPPATTNTAARKGKYVPKIQTRPPRTRGPLQRRHIPVWPEFIHVTPAVRANAAGHEAAVWMITHARNVPGLKTLGNTDLITSSQRSGDTPGDWKPVVIANFLNEWIRQNYNGLVLWNKEGKTFREQINWYDRRPLMEQADIRIFITQQVEALLPAADQQRIAQLRQNFQGPGSELATQVANGTWQPPIFGPPIAAFLAQVAAHDAAEAAQVNSGTQMNQMGPSLGGGPVVGTGGGSNSSQPPAGIGRSGANSSAAGGIQAPHPAQSADSPESRKRNRDDAGFDNFENSSSTQDLSAPPQSKKPRQDEESGVLVSQNMAGEQMLSSSNMLAQLTIQGGNLRSTEFGGGPTENLEHHIRGSTQAESGSRTGPWSPTSRSLDDSANMVYDNMTEGIARQTPTPSFESVHEGLEDIAGRTSRFSFGTGMHEQPGHLAGYGAPYSVAPYPIYGAPAQGPYGQQTPYDQSAHQTNDAPETQIEYGQQQFPSEQPPYGQPASQNHGPQVPAPWMQPSNPAGFDLQNLDPALFEQPASNLPTEDEPPEVPGEMNTPAEFRRRNALLVDEEEAGRIEAYWRNEESRARGGLAARPEVFSFGANGPSRQQRGSSVVGSKRSASADDEEEGDGHYSGHERARGKRHRES
jgi:hypothetical protein